MANGPLTGVRITDLTWLLAGAGGPRMLAAMGAEVIRCEWKDKLDFMRLGGSIVLPGEEVIPGPMGPTSREAMASINRSGNFNDVNPGKRGISLNLRQQAGKDLLLRLVAVSDVVMENYSATAMEEMGLGSDVLKQANPNIIYVQASGWGASGPYKNYLSYGPTAQAITGLTYTSGLPGREPAGWGFSYLDHHGGYAVANATLLALLHRKRTGKAVHVDMSQAATGLFLTGTATLDYAANGRQTQRTGNRSPWVKAAPHGAYKCDGVDRWVAIAVTSEAMWQGLVEAMGNPGWTSEPAFADMDSRIANQDSLDERIAAWTSGQDPYAVMDQLQARGVAAGVCQNSQDKCETDPQLRERGYFVDLPQSEMGTWPVQNVPFDYSRTPAEIGEPTGRASPNYGEDNDYVYGEILGIPADEREQLAQANVI